METLQVLALALGLSSLAGMRLYLTVFLTSLSLHEGWLKLDPAYGTLGVLGGDAILIVSGVLLVLEFLADKVQGFDSIWDSIHTFIRPVGATLISLQVLGEWPAEMKIVAALLLGGVALTVHTAKAGTRLLVNTSPEPLSNVAVSAAEDVAVAGLFALLVTHPLVAGVVFVGIVGFSLWAAPRAFRLAKATSWLLWQRLTRLPRPAGRVDLPRHLSADHDMLVASVFGPEKNMTPAWAVETLLSRVRRVRGLSSGRFGLLVASQEQPDELVFVARRFFRTTVATVPLSGCRIATDTTFLSENLTVYHRQTRQRVTFRFPRAESAIVAKLADELRSRLEPAAPEIAVAPRFSAGEREAVLLN